jgi:tetratricopeptide (TPR) repeat protein
MTLKYPFCLIIIISVFFSHMSYAQEKQLIISADSQYDYAQKLFETKDYDTAIVEYKRFIHFFSQDTRLDQAKFNTGLCLFNSKKFYDAAQTFNDIILKGKEDKLTQEAYFYQSQSFMNLGNTGYAEIVLQNYLKLTDEVQTRDRIYYNLAHIHLKNARESKPDSLSLSKEYFSKISESGKLKYNTDQYDDLIIKAMHAPKKNPKAAGIFAIVPGGGFLYCERYKDAFITFLLNTGLMVAAYEAWDNDNKALAGVIGLVETGFYTGNIYGSITSAHKYNQAQTLKILNKEFSIRSKLNIENQGYELSFNYEF